MKAIAVKVVQQESLCGFVFMDDFDRKQKNDIVALMEDVANGKVDVVRTSYAHENMEIPVVVIGRAAKSYSSNSQGYENWLNDYGLRSSINKAGITNEEDPFFCYTMDDDFVVIIANPYLENSSLLQMNDMFDTFAKTATENGIIYGTIEHYGRFVYMFLVGTKEDVTTQKEKGILPYFVNRDSLNFQRMSSSEIETAQKGNDILKAKIAIVQPRLMVIETLLQELTDDCFILSNLDDLKIVFEDETNPLNYRVWLETETNGEENNDWFDEKDLIDWLNMEGRVPFSDAQVFYYGRMLEEVSNGAYSYGRVNDELGYFNKDKVRLNLDEIKAKIEEFAPIKKFTAEDFEEAVKKYTIP